MATKKQAAAESAEAVSPEGASVDEAPVEAAPVAEPVVEAEPVVVAEPVVMAEPVDEVAVEQVPVEVVSVDAVPAAQQPETTVLTETTPPAPEVIVIDAPVPPRKKGNRGIGIALALLATVVFSGLLVAAAFALSLVLGGGIGFLTDPEFYFPSLFFFIGLVIVTLLLNRAGWWSHIIGSVVVGAITWFGSASLVLLAAGMFSMNQGEANDTFFAALFSPILIIAALLAREVAIWTGAILARRGRSLKVRNAEAQEAYEREQAELIPTTQG
jgi:hypothetical protein